ncbi:MAG: protoporphyrinogen oxidase [Acidobacteriia bacterium]|nr:protoporphyrinogen oxidase [Terriglobia bacterium]
MMTPSSSPGAPSRKIIVLGAGISGLTCAYRLHQAGIDVEVLDREAAPGGVMQTRAVDGFLTEGGPNSFQSGEEVLSLIHDVGLDGELLEADAQMPRYIYFRGQLHRAPMGPGALIFTKLLSAGAKLKLVREPWAPSNPDGHEESIREFVTRRLGGELHDVMLAPLVSGIYAGDTAKLSMQSVFPLLVELETKYGGLLKGFMRHMKAERKKREAEGRAKTRRTLCSFKNGLKTFPVKIAGQLGGRVHLNCEVRAVRANPGGGFTLEVQENGAMQEYRSDRLVLATPVFETAEHLKNLAVSLSAHPWPKTLSVEFTQAATDLASIELPPLAGVCLAWKKSDVPHNLNGFGFLIPRTEGIRLLGCIWSSSLYPHRAPDGWTLLTNFIGGATDPEIISLSEGQLVDAVRNDLQTILGMSAAPRVVTVNRYDHAIPQYNLGHKARIDAARHAVGQIPGLYLAGNYLSGVSVGDCIKQAHETVKQILSADEHG